MEKPNYRHPIKVYSPLLRIERMIYSISDMKLPFPLPIRQVGFFFLGLGFIILLGIFPPFGAFFKAYWLVSYFGFPIVIAIYLDKATLDGKPPLIYLIDRIFYTFQKGHYNRFEKIEKPAKIQFTGAIASRKGEETE